MVNLVLGPTILKSSAMLEDNLFPVELGHRCAHYGNIWSMEYSSMISMVPPPLPYFLKFTIVFNVL